MQHLVGTTTVPFFGGIIWHTRLQIVYGAFVLLIPPVLDGLTIDYVEKNYTDVDAHSGRNQRLYGKEHLHGTVW